MGHGINQPICRVIPVVFFLSFEIYQCIRFCKLICKCIPEMLLGLLLVQILLRLRNIYKGNQNTLQCPETAYSLFIPSLSQWTLKVPRWKLPLSMPVYMKFCKIDTEIIVKLLKIHADRFRNKDDIFMLVALSSVYICYQLAFIQITISAL